MAVVYDTQYEANVEPDSDGWTLGGNDYSAVDGGILTITTAQNAHVCYYYKTPDVDFDAGVYIKFRMKESANYSSVRIYDATQQERVALFIGAGTVWDSEFNVLCNSNQTNYQVFDLYIKGSSAKFYLDGVYKGAPVVDPQPGVPDRMLFGKDSTTDITTVYFDYFYYAINIGYNPMETVEFVYVGTGSLAFSGTATQVHSKDYLTAGSGGLAFSGSAVIIFGLAFVGSGLFAYSGEAIQSYTRDYLSTAVGELIYSGEAIFSYLCNFLFSGSGELAYSGSAEQSYTNDYSYTGTGGFTYSGSATQSYTYSFSYAGSGNLVFSGAADCIYEEVGADFIYTGTGSFNYSGVGIYSLGLFYVGSGELVYSGSAVVEKFHFVFVGSGTLIYSGEAEAVYYYKWIEIDKETSNWAKQDKIYMGWLVNGWLIYGWLIEIWEGIIKSTSNWNKINKE